MRINILEGRLMDILLADFTAEIAADTEGVAETTAALPWTVGVLPLIARHRLSDEEPEGDDDDDDDDDDDWDDDEDLDDDDWDDEDLDDDDWDDDDEDDDDDWDDDEDEDEDATNRASFRAPAAARS